MEFNVGPAHDLCLLLRVLEESPALSSLDLSSLAKQGEQMRCFLRAENSCEFRSCFPQMVMFNMGIFLTYQVLTSFFPL